MLSANPGELPVVPGVDLKRYQGRWFEIARLPNSFQRKCESDVTATYTLQPGGRIKVVNTCKKNDGDIIKSVASARLQEKDGSSAKLKVTFFWPFSGDYWIVDLDPGYQWAVVATPNRKYLWILSRIPNMSTSVYDKLLERVKELGFNAGALERSRQES